MGRYLAIPLLLLLAGCGFQQLQQGEPNFNTAILWPDPTAAVAMRDPVKLGLTPLQVPPACVEDPKAQGSTTNKTVISTCVHEVQTIIDNLYIEYRITLHHFADDGNAIADASVLGLTTAATGPIGATTGKYLTGFASFITGTKSILNQDLLYKQAIENIIHQMDTDRATRLTNINAAMSGSNYTLAQAKDDLLLYFAAGTWDDAITTIQTTIAANQVKCQAQADQSSVNQAQSAGNAGTPAATPTTCPPAPSPPPPLTYTAATKGVCFQQNGTPGIYEVVKPTPTATGQITVSFAPDGKTFLANSQTMSFAQFTPLVNPLPVKCPSS
jgi:hypothetical protein